RYRELPPSAAPGKPAPTTPPPGNSGEPLAGPETFQQTLDRLGLQRPPDLEGPAARTPATGEATATPEEGASTPGGSGEVPAERAEAPGVSGNPRHVVGSGLAGAALNYGLNRWQGVPPGEAAGQALVAGGLGVLTTAAEIPFAVAAPAEIAIPVVAEALSN